MCDGSVKVFFLHSHVHSLFFLCRGRIVLIRCIYSQSISFLEKLNHSITFDDTYIYYLSGYFRPPVERPPSSNTSFPIASTNNLPAGAPNLGTAIFNCCLALLVTSFFCQLNNQAPIIPENNFMAVSFRSWCFTNVAIETRHVCH